jgi:hypothetical protein
LQEITMKIWSSGDLSISSAFSGHPHSELSRAKRSALTRVGIALFAGIALQVAAATSATTAPAPAAVGSAQQAPVYALLSLVGDRMDVVSYRPRTGSPLDTNDRQSLTLDTPVFDNTVIASAASTIKKQRKDAETVALNTRSKVLFERQRELLVENAGTLAVPDAIRDALKEQRATHMLVFRKYSGPISDSMGKLSSSGSFEGLGFYLDPRANTVTETAPAASAPTTPSGASATTSEDRVVVGAGVISVFFYTDAILVSVPNMRIIAQERVAVAYPISARRNAATIAESWAALTSAQKIEELDATVRDEVIAVTQKLLQSIVR